MQAELLARGGVSVCFVLLAVLCWFMNEYYLSVLWDYFGFHHTNDGNAFAMALLLTFVVGLATPCRIDNPGALIVVMLAIVVVVPSVAITLAQPEGLEVHGWLVVCLAIGHIFAAVAAQTSNGSGFPIDIKFIRYLMIGFTVAWVLMTVLLVATYWRIMTFATIDETYVQRELGRSTSVWMSYLQTYYINVICPALFAYGLTQSGKRHFALLGGVGFLVIYAITAQKYALGAPIVLAGLYAGFKMRAARYTAVLAGAVCLLMTLSFWDFSVRGERSIIAALVLHRTVGIPALTLGQYQEVFGQFGYTLWGHVRGLSLLSPAPLELTVHPMWPNLGYIVGDLALSMPENNVNANLFASDGAGALGEIGVLLIAVVLSVYISLLNWAARGIQKDLVVLLIFPVALTLTNGPFFTVMLSFGGAFWLILFAVIQLWARLSVRQGISVLHPGAPETVTAGQN